MIRDLLEQKPYLKKIILISLLVIVLIIIIIILVSVFKKTILTYSELEDKMQSAAIDYYESNKDKLPNDGSTITISYDTLEEDERLKSIDSYLEKGNTCSGRVVIRNTNDNYSYTPFLDCGDDYKTIELYNKILNDNELVTEGNGLYQQGDSKIFRGENLDNFVSIGDNLWRIVKIDSDNSVKLILYSKGARSTWDDRYNSEKGASYGKNTYSISRLKEQLDELYDSETFISSEIKSKLVDKPLCIGKRSIDSTTNDGSLECSEIIEDQYLGSLTLSEYITASLDPKCQSVNNRECQNYNYLIEYDARNPWWLITAVSENTYQAYYVSNYGSIEDVNCSVTAHIRPTLYLSMETIYSSGEGTEEDPYIIK